MSGENPAGIFARPVSFFRLDSPLRRGGGGRRARQTFVSRRPPP